MNYEENDDNDDFQDETIEPIDNSEFLEESNEDLPPLLEEADDDEVESLEESNGERRKKKELIYQGLLKQ